MKKSAKFITLFVSLFALSSCDFDIGFLQFSDNKKVIEESGETSESESSSQDPKDEGEPEGPKDYSFEYIKSYATTVAAQMLGISEDEVKYGDYDDETLSYYPDVYTYETTDLMFASADLSIEDKDFNATIDALKSFLPTDAVYDETQSEGIDTDYGTCDLYYKSGDYYYSIYVEDWYVFVWAKFDVFPISQIDAYKEKVYGEDDWDWLDDDMSDEEWEEFLASLGEDEE